MMTESDDGKTSDQSTRRRRRRPGLATWILIGLVLGAFCGLFFGEACAWLGLLGRAYVGLLQMSILPYMVVSLVGGTGNLDREKARKLALSGGIILLASWGIALLIVFTMPLAFPTTESGSFFSASLVESRSVDFIDLYIPVNPFSSLARTIVPAAALFSVMVGIALVGLPLATKQPLLDVLSILSSAFGNIATMVIKLAPIGIFSIAANAAGTMSIDEFSRLQVYLVTFVVSTLLLTFWVLPGLVVALMPFRYLDILRSCRTALITGFVTGNLFIVLPELIENAKRLFEQYGLRSTDTDSYVEVLVPTSFNFPNIGKLLTLLFVLFAGWYTGSLVSAGSYPSFAVLGICTLFGGVDLALPFLLDEMRISSDMYQLYVVTGVVNGWFATLLAVMNLFAFTLVAAGAAAGQLKPRMRFLALYLVITLCVLCAAVVGMRLGLSRMVGGQRDTQLALAQMEISQPVDVVVHRSLPDDLSRAESDLSRLAAIQERGTLRVGYNADSLPFAFFNEGEDLVGLDVELFHGMARDLGVTIEFLPWKYDTLYAQLEEGQFDLVAGGLLVTPSRLARLAFSEPYMTVTVAVVVPDYRRHDFAEWERIETRGREKIGIVAPELGEPIRPRLPRTEFLAVSSISDYFETNPLALDALVIGTEAGSAWTIFHPDYAVAIPKPQVHFPIAIALPGGSQKLADFVDDWIGLKRTSGEIDALYDKWILGKGARPRRPRWCIARDVLGWFERERRF